MKSLGHTGNGRTRAPDVLDLAPMRFPYRLELLPAVPAFHRRARIGKALSPGQLVYYGPSPVYYGIGEITRIVGNFVAVDFRGTGQFGVHEDVFEHRYLMPLPAGAHTIL